MSIEKKFVRVSLKNHEFLKQLSFINDSSIESELDKIIDKIRKSKDVKIIVTRNE